MLARFRVHPTEHASLVLARGLKWLAASALFVAALSLASVHAPNRIKLIGLFSIAFGLLCGWVFGKLCHMLRVHYAWPAAVIALLLAATGVVGMTVESYRLWRDDRQQALQSSPADLLAAQALSQTDEPQDPQTRKQFQEFKETFERRRQRQLDALSFVSFLEHRTSQLKWPTPIPQVLWLTEVCCAGGFAAWLTHRAAGRRFCTQCQSWFGEQRSVLVDAKIGSEVLDDLRLGLGPDSPFTDASQSQRRRLAVVLLGCRCPGKVGEVRCEVEDDAGRTHRLGTVCPPADAWERIIALLDDAGRG